LPPGVERARVLQPPGPTSALGPDELAGVPPECSCYAAIGRDFGRVESLPGDAEERQVGHLLEILFVLAPDLQPAVVSDPAGDGACPLDAILNPDRAVGRVRRRGAWHGVIPVNLCSPGILPLLAGQPISAATFVARVRFRSAYTCVTSARAWPS